MTRLKDGSEWEADCAANNLKIVTRGIFSESSRSGSSKFKPRPPGTPTMFIEIFEVERGRGLWRGCAG